MAVAQDEADRGEAPNFQEWISESDVKVGGDSESTGMSGMIFETRAECKLLEGVTTADARIS
jgi:hypothetical protein